MEAVAELKNDPSIRRIALSGSVSVRQLLDAGLLDELHLFVHPATAGSTEAVRGGRSSRHLKLLVEVFDTGVLYAVYGPDPTSGTGSHEEAKEKLPQD